MSKYDIKLGSVISFDTEKEQDIIEFIRFLTQRKMLGDFINNLIRDSFDDESDTTSLGKMADYRKGISITRNKFFNKVRKDVNDMHELIDTLYCKCIEIEAVIKSTEMNIDTFKEFSESTGSLVATLIKYDRVAAKQLKELGINFGTANLKQHTFDDIDERDKINIDNALENFITLNKGILKELDNVINSKKIELATSSKINTFIENNIKQKEKELRVKEEKLLKLEKELNEKEEKLSRIEMGIGVRENDKIVEAINNMASKINLSLTTANLQQYKECLADTEEITDYKDSENDSNDDSKAIEFSVDNFGAIGNFFGAD